jgi:iron complex outermembrane receptor protein
MRNMAFVRGISASALAFASIIHASSVQAQSSPGAIPETGQGAAADSTTSEVGATIGEIVVTGSRLARTGYDSPTPVNVIGSERMKALAIPNVADALNQLPSFRAIVSPASNFFRVSGNIGARTLDLRGLGPTRTLTLVDGRRVVGSSDNGTVDINGIPSIMVARAEVVTGGASAAYGANAVSGVVNLILDTKLNGIKTDMNKGISQRGDASSFYAAIAGGADFAGGSGHIVAGAEFSKEGGIGPCETRDFCRKYTNYISNPGYNATTRTSTNGLPATLVLDNVTFVYNENGILTSAVKPGATPGSTITLGQQLLNTGATSLPAALRNKQFDSNGNLVPYTFGALLSGLFQVGTDTTQPYMLGLGQQPLSVPTEHVSAMTHADYDFTDTITGSAEFMYSRVIGGPTSGSSPLDGPASLDINNPYISASARATILAADPRITRINVNSASSDLGVTNISKTKIETFRAMAGLKGKVFSSWDWDTYYVYGRVNARLDDQNTRLAEWTQAFDVIPAPAGNALGVAAGTPVCRIAVTPANGVTKPGCIPINLLGPNSVSRAAATKYIIPEWQTRTFQQHAAAINLRGSLFDTWAGPVKVAAGAEWRRDTAVGDADANTLAGLFLAPQATALPYTRTTVTEGYVEAGIPLLNDSPIGKSLDIDGAARRSHYNPFGDAWTWKVGLVYTPVSDITLRVTKSSDVRAPTAAESSPNSTQITLPLADPFIGATTNQNVVTGGNPGLHLERGDTFTAGVVLKPSFLRRFNMSVDYYNIKVKGAIDSLSGSGIATACKQQNLLCNLILFKPNGAIDTVFSTFQNLSRLHAEGYELVADYSFPLLSGNMALQVNGNYVVDLSTIDGTGVATQLDNWTGNNGSVTNIQGVPRWKLDGVMTYARDTWSVTAHGRYIPRALLDPTKIGAEQTGYDINLPNSQSINHVSSRFYLDISGTVKIANITGTGKAEIYASITNVMDKSEPRQLRLIGNPLQFDPVGRAFRLGIRTSW